MIVGGRWSEWQGSSPTDSCGGIQRQASHPAPPAATGLPPYHVPAHPTPPCPVQLGTARIQSSRISVAVGHAAYSSRVQRVAPKSGQSFRPGPTGPFSGYSRQLQPPYDAFTRSATSRARSVLWDLSHLAVCVCKATVSGALGPERLIRRTGATRVRARPCPATLTSRFNRSKVRRTLLYPRQGVCCACSATAMAPLEKVCTRTAPKAILTPRVTRSGERALSGHATCRPPG